MVFQNDKTAAMLPCALNQYVGVELFSFEYIFFCSHKLNFYVYWPRWRKSSTRRIMLGFYLVLTYDQLGERRICDVIITFAFALAHTPALSQ